MTDDQTPTGALTVQGPRHTFASELRSVANSIEPLFPDAADLLRGIARHNEESGAALAEAEQKGAREAWKRVRAVLESTEWYCDDEHDWLGKQHLCARLDRAAQVGGESDE